MKPAKISSGVMASMTKAVGRWAGGRQHIASRRGHDSLQQQRRWQRQLALKPPPFLTHIPAASERNDYAHHARTKIEERIAHLGAGGGAGGAEGSAFPSRPSSSNRTNLVSDCLLQRDTVLIDSLEQTAAGGRGVKVAHVLGRDGRAVEGREQACGTRQPVEPSPRQQAWPAPVLSQFPAKAPCRSPSGQALPGAARPAGSASGRG